MLFRSRTLLLPSPLGAAVLLFFSRLKNNSTAAPNGDGNNNVRSNLYSFTGGIYHQWTKSLKLVFEGTEEGSTNGPRPKQVDVSGGFMLFF